MSMTLDDFFASNSRIAIAFSGGVDSAYLLYAAQQAGADVTAYYVKTPFQPQFELNDAVRLTEQLGIPMRMLTRNVLEEECIAENSAQRCYFCKRFLFSALLKAAAEDGYTVIADGTNASDDSADRPGMRALRELSVRSPLRECGLTKSEIRRRSKEAGLFTWDKPAYACLATRVRCGQRIEADTLARVEQAEAYLHACGFSDLRVRVSGNTARLQLPNEQFSHFFADEAAIRSRLETWFDAVLFDLDGRG